MNACACSSGVMAATSAGDLGSARQPVRALDNTPDTALGNHLETPACASRATCRYRLPGLHSPELRRQLPGGERTITQERLDDAQAHRMQQEVRTRHNEMLTQTLHY